jgi:hypothetical protein
MANHGISPVPTNNTLSLQINKLSWASTFGTHIALTSRNNYNYTLYNTGRLNMPISNLRNDLPNNTIQPSPLREPTANAYDRGRTANFQKIFQAQGKNPISAPAEHKKIFLGVINNNSPTVSHLLTNNSTFKQDAWNIIFSDINKEKNFGAIPKGDEVELDLQTNEITWHKTKRQPPIITPELMAKQDLTEDNQIIIGKISPDSPTVSHLLRHNKIYHDEAWNIILSDINSDKPYKSLRNGTSVAINPQTFELSFLNGSKNISAKSQTISSAAKDHLASMASDFFKDNKPFADRLVQSIRPYIGKPYKQIDCYGLLVRGLKNQGIQYGGSGGLRENLEQMARQNGVPLNAYQNGEGLIAAAGKTVYSKSFNSVMQPDSLSQKTFTELKPNLHAGMILSFSTPTRGHTGIISKDNGLWTYINSGLMDHQVNSGKITRRVGEESLQDEVTNWFKLANDRHESLKVTMGMLDEEKLRDITGATKRFAKN